MDNQETKEYCLWLRTLLVNTRELQSEVKAKLKKLQEQCGHQGTEMYKGHQIGQCPVCGSELFTKEEVDRGVGEHHQ